MNIIKSSTPDEVQKAAIFRLWNAEYPQQLQYTAMHELDTYLGNLQQQLHYFAADDNGQIVGWAFTFVREGGNWFAIIITRAAQGQGIGSRLLNNLEQNGTPLNGWVTDHDRYTRADGTAYPSPLSFYLANGFEVCRDIRLEVAKLSAVKITKAPVI